MSEQSNEREIALREAHALASQDEYFAPRPVEDGAMQRRAFDQGFTRGWKAARAAPDKASRAPAPISEDLIQRLRSAAQAVVDRWDTPLWKDVPHTGEFIACLRRALAAFAHTPTPEPRAGEAETFDDPLVAKAWQRFESAVDCVSEAELLGLWFGANPRGPMLGKNKVLAYARAVIAADRDARAALAASPEPRADEACEHLLYRQGKESARIALHEWAVDRWRGEVEHRPINNINRRPLDDAWRAVIRFAGGDPEALLGPSHDELRSRLTTNEYLALAASPIPTPEPRAGEREDLIRRLRDAGEMLSTGGQPSLGELMKEALAEIERRPAPRAPVAGRD